MDKNTYLRTILKLQTLAEGSSELKDLREKRAEVEALLREAFEDASPTIRYGGSVAKGTLIKESYDLDIICYFLRDDTTAGETLEDIFRNVKEALASKYAVTPKTSSIRLMSPIGADFHIDVVPGRFVDDAKSDAFLFQAAGDKKRLKTNFDVHIAHVKVSGVVDAIRLFKLWKARNRLQVRQFALELLVIKLLDGKSALAIADQLTAVWTYLRDHENPVTIEDPANPTGNDVSGLLDATVWTTLSFAARATLDAIDRNGWESVFGAVEVPTEAAHTERLQRAAAASVDKTKPWCTGA